MKISRLLILILIAGLLPFQTLALAESGNDIEIGHNNEAQALKNLGLFHGSEKGFELNRAPTRTEAAVMLVRLLGKEEQAKERKQEHPFKDVPDWASPYVSYMYQNGLTTGISKTEFGSNDSVEAKQYVTFLLRVLGYSDKNGDFNYEHSLDFAWDMGILNKHEYDLLKIKEFLRDDVVGLSYGALSCVLNNNTRRLSNKLIDEGVFTKEDAEANGINTSDGFYTVEDYGQINGVPFFKDITVGIDPIHGGKYTAVGKHLRFKIDRNSLPASMKNYTKVTRTEIYGTINDTKVRDAFSAIAKTKKYSDESNYEHDGNGNVLIYGSRCNALLFIIADQSDKPIGYTVVKLLGFKDLEEYQDVTYRYEKVGIGDIDGIAFFEDFQIFNSGSTAQIRVNQKRLSANMRDFKMASLLSYGYIKDFERWIQEETRKEDIIKDITGDYNNYSFEKDLTGSSFYPDQVSLFKIGDSKGKAMGYCILRQKIKSILVR